jgi:hypothetical protein
MKRTAFFASFFGALFLLAGASYFFLFYGTKATAVISSVASQNIIGTGAQIIWTTDIPADSRVAYGTSPTAYSSFSNYRCDSGGYVTAHCVNLTGLSTSTPYYYKVESMDTSSVGSFLGGFQFISATGNTYTSSVPSAASGLSVVLNTAGTDATFSWTDASSNEAVFKIFRRLYGDTAWNYFMSVDMNITSLIYPGIPFGTYEYYVSACNAFGCSTNSNIVSVARSSTLDTTAPSVPQNVSATTVSTSEINLSWTASTDNVSVEGYNIYRNSAFLVTVNSLSYSDTALPPGTLYYYTVAAVDGAKNFSPTTKSISATTFSDVLTGGSTLSDATTSPIISSLEAKNITDSGAQIVWNTDSLSSSKGYYGTAPGAYSLASTWRCDAGGNVTSHCVNLTALTPATRYYYQVISVNSAGYQTKSTEQTFVSAASSQAVITTPVSISTTTTATTIPAPLYTQTTTLAPIVSSPRAYIALWQGDVHVVAGQTIQGDIKINVGVENADAVFLYLKNSVATELLGQAVRATDRPSLWRFSWNSKTIQNGDAVIFSRVRNESGEYAGDTVPVVIKNVAPANTPPPTTHSEAVSIVNELFSHPENLEVAKAFLTPKIDKFLQKTSVEEKQRASEQIRKELGLDILVSDTGSVEVQIGTTTLSRQTEPTRVVEDISRMVKNRSGESVLKDTDSDGISDYDEVYIYNTDPKHSDTDGDGVNDGDEILLGMNPLKNETTLVSYEDPKKVTVAAKADPKEFSVDKMELVPAVAAGSEGTTNQYIALSGTALPNSFVRIYIFSTPVVVTIKTDGDGKWKYTMDKELENGKHEVYVAMTESAGKIILKSDPIPFVKTAQAVTLQLDFAEASSAESPAGFFHGGTLALSLAVLLLVIGLSFMAISFVSKKRESSDE